MAQPTLDQPPASFTAQSLSHRIFRIDWAIAALLVLAAIGWRLPYAIRQVNTQSDERLVTVPTIQYILQNRSIPPFQVGSDYMAPVQEIVSTFLQLLLGPTTLALRLPAIAFYALGVGVNYLTVRRFASRVMAIGTGSILVFGNSACIYYSTLSIGEYGITFLTMSVLTALALTLSARSANWKWLELGVVAGVSIYIFSITALQLGVVAVWLFLRSEYLRERVAGLDRSEKRRLLAAGAMLGVGGVLFLLVGYRYLTRAEVYQLSLRDAAVAIAGGIFVSAAAIVALVHRWPSRNSVLRVALILVPSVVIPFIPKVLATPVPIQTELGPKPIYGSPYAWKHAHEWPSQVRLFFGRVLPLVVAGRADQSNEELASAGIPLCGPLVLWVLFLILLLLAAVAYGRTLRSGHRLFDPAWMFVGGWFAIILVLVPSWRLFGDASYRYLIPFQAGLAFAMTLTARMLTRRREWAMMGLIALYALYCMYDAIYHLPTIGA